LGLTAGLATSLVTNNIVIIAAIVEMFAGAVSMAAGTYLSSKSQLEFINKEVMNHREEKAFIKHTFNSPIRASSTIFLFYVLAAIPPIIPYIFLDIKPALITSIAVSALFLFGIGVWKTKLTKRDALKSGLEMLFIGLLAALAGFIVGNVIHLYTGLV